MDPIDHLSPQTTNLGVRSSNLFGRASQTAEMIEEKAADAKAAEIGVSFADPKRTRGA